MKLRVSTTINSTRWLKSAFKEPPGCRFLYGVILFIRMIRVALARVIKYNELNGSALFLFELFD